MTNSIKKGNQGQRDVANLFKRWFPDAQSSSHMQRNRDSKVPDIMGGVEKYFYVEVKRYKKIYPGQLVKWYAKAVGDSIIFSDSFLRVIIVYREDKKKWMVYDGNIQSISWESYSGDWISREIDEPRR